MTGAEAYSLGRPKLIFNGGPLGKSRHLLYCVVFLRCKMVLGSQFHLIDRLPAQSATLAYM